MSGGSWDYIYSRLQMDAVDRLCQEKSPLRRAFGEHLAICCDALRAIEWVDSGDWGEGSDVKYIIEALGDTSAEDAPLLKEIKMDGHWGKINLHNKPITTTATHEES